MASKPFASRFRIILLKLPEIYERIYESVPLAASLLVPSFDTQRFPGDLRQLVFVLAPVTSVIIGVISRTSLVISASRYRRFSGVSAPPISKLISAVMLPRISLLSGSPCVSKGLKV